MKLHIDLNEQNRIIGYQTFPILENREVFELEEIPEDLADGAYGLENGIIKKLGFTEDQLQEQVDAKKNGLRAKREPLLTAFDKWEKAVLRGREVDSEEVMLWYQDLLKLEEEEPFENIPDRVAYYLRNKE